MSSSAPQGLNGMRKITAGLFYSVDGVAETPNLWQFDQFDDEIGAALGQMMSVTDTVLLGRTLYQEWADHWPKADDPFARFINGVTKYVPSTTLSGELAWSGSHLIEGDLLEFVRGLKAGEGGEIAVSGMSVVRQLLLAGLLDELTLIVHPVLAGAGQRPLFEPDGPTTRLQLVRGQITSSGNALLTYGPRPE